MSVKPKDILHPDPNQKLKSEKDAYKHVEQRLQTKTYWYGYRLLPQPKVYEQHMSVVVIEYSPKFHPFSPN